MLFWLSKLAGIEPILIARYGRAHGNRATGQLFYTIANFLLKSPCAAGSIIPILFLTGPIVPRAFSEGKFLAVIQEVMEMHNHCFRRNVDHTIGRWLKTSLNRLTREIQPNLMVRAAQG